MPERFISPIEDIIEDARQGRMYILVDDEDRENEGDLIIPAQHATPDAVNFMARFGRGLICLPMTEDRVEELGLNMMTNNNKMRHQTAFTVSIEAREGVTTGISAADRAKTIEVATDPKKGRYDLATPGHVFPLVARDGGVLVRAGHTEASVDISRLAGCNPSAVICEIMKDDGSMARLPDLIEFAKEHDLKLGTIADLIAYRLKHDQLIDRVSQTVFTRKSGNDWTCRVYSTIADDQEAIALIYGDADQSETSMVRMHVYNPFEDMLGEDSARSGQLQRAMDIIEQEDHGVVVIFAGNKDARPSTLVAKKIAKTQGIAQRSESAIKNIGYGAQIMIDMGIKHMILLSNTDSHVIGLEGYGLDIVEQRKIPLD